MYLYSYIALPLPTKKHGASEGDQAIGGVKDLLASVKDFVRKQ